MADHSTKHRFRFDGAVSTGFVVLAVWAASVGCTHEPARQQRQVTASAYNSLAGQTEGDPTATACGERLRPGMRVIAVSRDLFAAGLVCGTRVRIEGLPDEYLVADKMAERWSNKIDLYMGTDREQALAWGKRRVHISWVDHPAP